MSRWYVRFLPLAISACLISSCARESQPDKIPVIGITQIVSHPALDQSVRGFTQALAEAGFVEGTTVLFDRQNAQGEMAIAMAISQKFRDEDLALIFSLTTPASQAVARTVRDTPVVFCAVSDPLDAGIVPGDSAPGTATGTNITGVSDRWPVAAQLKLFTRFAPQAKTWGTIYNAGEANSLVHIREMRQAARNLGLVLTEATITGSSEAVQAAQSLAGRVQAMNITSDNTVASAFQAVVKVCNDRKIPLFSGDPDFAALGAVAAYGPDYFLSGKIAGKKAARILRGEKPGAIPWGPAQRFSLIVNPEAARAQGLIIPPDMLRQADHVLEGRK